MKNRRKARELALEALYRLEITKDDLEAILSDIFTRTHLSKEITGFTRQLVCQAAEELSEIDSIIIKTVANWQLERIAILDKNILRIAICELLHFPDIPFKVTIDEAIELAKKYSTTESRRFVNGVLDRVAKDGLRNNQ
jgi:N utilization substance protein B